MEAVLTGGLGVASTWCEDGLVAGDRDVGPADMLPDGKAVSVELETGRIGLYNVGGEIYAMDDLCSHDQAFLSEGDLNPAAKTIRCPRHSSHFDLTTGRPTTLPAIRPVRTYPAQVKNGRIIVVIDI